MVFAGAVGFFFFSFFFSNRVGGPRGLWIFPFPLSPPWAVEGNCSGGSYAFLDLAWDNFLLSFLPFFSFE